MKTTFIIPSLDRPTLERAIDSCRVQAEYLVGVDYQHVGPAAMRNDLIRHAQTEWISFCDDDDTVTSDYVQRLNEEIEKNPDVDLIYFRAYWAEYGLMFPAWPMTGGFGTGIFFSVKREIAMEFPFLDEASEDQQFVDRIEKAGKKIVFSKYITYRVRH